MKLICLNTWGGRAGKEGILNFFRTYKDVDVFCLQETWNGGHYISGKVSAGRVIKNIMHDFVADVGVVLDTHRVIFRPHVSDWFGLTIVIRKDIEIVNEGDFFVYRDKGYMPPDGRENADHARNLQYVTIKQGDTVQTIFNFHGLWTGTGKSDTPARIEQSRRIVEFMKTIDTPKVLCGDFNLRPDTESVRMIEKDMKDLITEHGITSTRTTLYDRPEKYADYVFVSPEVQVKEFKVLPDVVSDHAALYLKWEV